MKKLILTLTVVLGLTSCQNLQEDNDVQATFDANCETVKSSIDNFQNEVATYDEFSVDFVSSQTGYNPTGDSTSLEEMKENRTMWWAVYDAKLITDLRLLPGVNPETNEVDGSVRYYGQWEVTKTATDSTDAASVIIPIYASYDFDKEGKILYAQTYGDMTAAFESIK
jgi:hypothetical protein